MDILPLLDLVFVVLFFVVILAAKWLYNLTVPYNTFNEIIDNKNVALSVSIVGFFTASSIIYVAVLFGPSVDLVTDLINVVLYTALGMALLLLSRFINNKVLLHSFCNHDHIAEKQSLSVGLVQAACYITSGLIIGGSLMGDGDLLSALVFYGLGQVSLILFAKVYDWLTTFDLLVELEKNNVAAAISFSATIIAIGIILLHALTGEFISWQTSLTIFALDAAIALVTLPIIRVLVDKALMPSVNIDDAIQTTQNTAIALLEGAVAISIALVILCAL